MRGIPFPLVCALILPTLAGCADRPVTAPDPIPAPPAALEQKSSPAAATGLRKFVTRHQGVFGGTSIRYVAEAGDTPIEDNDRLQIGRIFAYSYLREDAPPQRARPVAFIFNGGPGSSSFWLHAGAFGPKRAAISADPDQIPTEERLIDNPDSPLDLCDLVFVDPVGTGFSTLAGAGKPEQFYGSEPDAAATAEFIRRWLAEHDRWTSPKILIGESYGTARAALTVKALIGGVDIGRFPAIDIDGIVLMGTALNAAAGDEGFASNLPSLAAVARHYGKATDAKKPLADFLAEVRAFAGHDYLSALFAGDRLAAKERRQIAEKLSRMIGLPVDFILGKNLRVDPHAFAEALLSDRQRVLSLYDARYSFAKSGAPVDPVGDDASMTRTGPAIMEGFMAYLREDLGIDLATRYEGISWFVNRSWKYPANRYNLALDIGRAARQNPRLKVLVAAGIFDLATTMGGAEYAIVHGDIPMDRVHFTYYESGHMPYIGQENAKKLGDDLRAFVKSLAR